MTMGVDTHASCRDISDSLRSEIAALRAEVERERAAREKAEAEVERLKGAIENGVRDGTLDCVVRGKAPECPELGIRRPEQMCGACRIRVTAQVRRREEGER